MKPLSPRECQVVELIASGKQNKAIARELGISHKTVSNAVFTACNKLGAVTRSQAAVLYDRARR